MTFPDDTPAPAAIARILAATDHRPFVVGQLGQSLDGRIATPTGESRWINGSAALAHLHAIRAVVDAVVVGVGTVVADDPRLNVRLVTLPPGRLQPARVVLDPRGRVPHQAVCFDPATGGPTIQIVGPHLARRSSDGPPAHVRQLEVPTTDGRFCPRAVVQRLFDEGYRTLLIEGGAATVSAFLQAGALDRLHVLVAPVLIGSGTSGLTLPGIDKISEAQRPKCETHAFEDGDVLFDCDLRTCLPAS
ncbi:MAG: RibD family protein [Pseudomonadota bacterium]